MRNISRMLRTTCTAPCNHNNNPANISVLKRMPFLTDPLDKSGKNNPLNIYSSVTPTNKALNINMEAVYIGVFTEIPKQIAIEKNKRIHKVYMFIKLVRLYKIVCFKYCLLIIKIINKIIDSCNRTLYKSGI